MHAHGPGIRTTDARCGCHPTFCDRDIDIRVVRRSIVHLVDQWRGVPTGRGAADGFRRGSVVDAKGTLAIGRDVGMDPRNAVLGVVVDDLPAETRAALVLRDAEAVRKFSFDQVARLGRNLRWWLGNLGTENLPARETRRFRVPGWDVELPEAISRENLIPFSPQACQCSMGMLAILIARKLPFANVSKGHTPAIQNGSFVPTQDLYFPHAFRKDLAFDSLGVAAPSEDTKSQAMRKVRSRSARDILDNRISIVGCGA